MRVASASSDTFLQMLFRTGWARTARSWWAHMHSTAVLGLQAEGGRAAAAAARRLEPS